MNEKNATDLATHYNRVKQEYIDAGNSPEKVVKQKEYDVISLEKRIMGQGNRQVLEAQYKSHKDFLDADIVPVNEVPLRNLELVLLEVRIDELKRNKKGDHGLGTTPLPSGGKRPAQRSALDSSGFGGMTEPGLDMDSETGLTSGFTTGTDLTENDDSFTTNLDDTETTLGSYGRGWKSADIVDPDAEY